jgi:hypothetical protein
VWGAAPLCGFRSTALPLCVKGEKMNEEVLTKTEGNVFIKFGNGVISFIVGLSAFSIIKLVFMLPINFMVTPENAELMESVGALLLILAIYLAVKFTKNLNRSGTRKSRNIKRTLTVVIGMACMLITTVFFAVSKSM